MSVQPRFQGGGGGIVVVVVDDDDRFYIALFSALKQTHCVLVACDSECVAIASYSAILTMSTGVVCLQRCSVVTWLVPWDVKRLPSRSVLCTPYNHAQCHVTSRKATHVGCMRV